MMSNEDIQKNIQELYYISNFLILKNKKEIRKILKKMITHMKNGDFDKVLIEGESIDE